MDGVLVDSELAHGRAVVAVLERHGLRFGGSLAGRADRDVFARALGATPDEPAVAALVSEKDTVYRALRRSVEPVPGAFTFARALLADGVRLAVVTSSSRADVGALADRFGWADVFEATVAAEDVRRAKPDPEPYQRGAASLGLSPSECVAVEDSPAGVASARAAGCRVLAVATTVPADALADADVVVPGFRDVAVAWAGLARH